MMILGIDPGVAITGFGLISQSPQGDAAMVQSGVFRTGSDLPLPERLNHLYEQLHSLISTYSINHGAVEKLFFQKNVKTAISVSQARGVILLCFAQAGIPVYDYAPMEVKLAVAGYGNADKKQVQQMVQVILGLSEIPKPDDAADALAVAICHLHSHRLGSLSREP